MSNYVRLSELIKSVSITHKFDKEELVFLNTSDVSEGKILINYYSKVSELKGQAKKTIKNGDILYSEIRPKNRRYAYVRGINNVEDYVVSTKLMVLRNNSKLLDTDYLYHFLTNDETLNYLQKRAENRIGSFPQITFDVLKTLQIWLPDIAVQKSIAKVLSDLDAKIELNNKINQELEAMAKTLYDYWFVQFEFPFDFAQGMPYSPHSEGCPQDGVVGKPYKTSGGKMAWNKELKREIPEGWEVKDLSEVTSSIMRGISPKYLDEGGICVLNQKCIRDQEVKFEFGRRHDHELKSASSKLIQYGDVLVNSTGFGTLGRVAIVKRLQEQTTAVDSHITIVRCENESIKKLFLGYSMLIRQSEIEGLAEGSTGQTELSRVNLGQLKMVIPPIESQSRFEKFSEPLIQKMAVNEAENQQLASLRDWLLPMLMNGQVTVGAKEKGNYEVKVKMDVAAEPERN